MTTEKTHETRRTLSEDVFCPANRFVKRIALLFIERDRPNGESS